MHRHPSPRSRSISLEPLLVLALVLLPVLSQPVIAAPQPQPSPRPLGTVTPLAESPKDCPPVSSCESFRVVCPGTSEPKIAYASTRQAQGPVRGVLVLFSGDIGHRWWALESGSTAFLAQLQTQGFSTIQVRWAGGWSVAAPGEDAGTGRLACRPASLIKWIHDHRYLPLGLPTTPVGRCGYCVTGNSGGASQITYALSFYGLDRFLDGVFPTAGPPHAAQDKGCLRREGQAIYYYGGNAAVIDQAHGFFGEGPCRNADDGFLSRWLTESVDTGGNDFVHPETRLHFIHSDDDVPSVPHALDYIQKLRRAGTPLLTEEVIPGLPHRLQSSPAGLEALYQAILSA